MPRIAPFLTGLLVLTTAFAAAAFAEPKRDWLVDQTIGESFGVQVKEWETSPQELDAIKNAGFGLLRYGIGWPYVEDSSGKYNWERYDAFISEVRARGLRSIIVLIGSHPSYAGQMGSGDHSERITPAPTSNMAVTGFARFAAAATERYRGDDITWELWNEPDLDRFWPPSARPIAYARLALAACRSIREAVPTAKVIGPAAAGMPGWKDSLGIGLIVTILRSPVSSCLDAISVHSYRREGNAPPKTPESVMPDNARASRYVARNGRQSQPALPLICSEWGYNSVELTEEQQATYVLRTHLSNLLSGIPVTVWYEWRDSADHPNDPEAHYGLTNYWRNDKPAIKGVRRVLPLIRDYKVERRLPIGDQRDYVLLLRDLSNNKKLLFWTARSSGETVSLQIAGVDKSVRLRSFPAIAAVPTGAPEISVIGDSQ
jgi:hypothetical protein